MSRMTNPEGGDEAVPAPSFARQSYFANCCSISYFILM
jgi:hypothetical protein